MGVGVGVGVDVGVGVGGVGVGVGVVVGVGVWAQTTKAVQTTRRACKAIVILFSLLLCAATSSALSLNAPSTSLPLSQKPSPI